MPRSYLMTGAFWAGTAERAAKTVAQVILALFAVDATTTVLTVDYRTAAGVALTAGLMSVLTSIVSGPVGPPGSPSLVNDRSRPTPEVSV